MSDGHKTDASVANDPSSTLPSLTGANPLLKSSEEGQEEATNNRNLKEGILTKKTTDSSTSNLNLEEKVAHLTGENRLLSARIRGYQILSQLLEETKKELKLHRQENQELQKKLQQQEDENTSPKAPADEQDNVMDQECQPTTEPTVCPTDLTNSLITVNNDTQVKLVEQSNDTAQQSATSSTRTILQDEPSSKMDSSSSKVRLQSPNVQQHKQFKSSTEESLPQLDFLCKTPLQSLPQIVSPQLSDFAFPGPHSEESNRDISVKDDSKPITDFSRGSSSGPSFVVLQRQTNEPSSTVSLWSMSEQSLQSMQSSVDSSCLSSRECSNIQTDEEDVDAQDEVAEQIKTISEALEQICNVSSQSKLAPELARLASLTLGVEKQLKLKKTLYENMSTGYDKLRKKVHILFPEYEKQNTQLRQENDQLFRRVRQLEHERDELALPSRSQSSGTFQQMNEWSHISRDSTVGDDSEKKAMQKKSTSLQAAAAASDNEKQLKEKIEELTIVIKKSDERNSKQISEHKKQMAEFKEWSTEKQTLLEKQYQEGLIEMKKLFRAEKEKSKQLDASLKQEIRRRERAEGEISFLQLGRKDLQNRTQALEAQIEFYRTQPPQSIWQETEEGQLDSIAGMNIKDMRTRLRVQNEQVTTYKEDFEAERRDRERLVGEIESLKVQNAITKQELKNAQEKIRQLTHARQMERSIPLPIPVHQMYPYAIHRNEPLTKHQVATNWQWEQVARKWRCSRCTYDNEPIRKYCELCTAPKPTIYGSAAPGSVPVPREAARLSEDEPMMSEELVHRSGMEDRLGTESSQEETVLE